MLKCKHLSMGVSLHANSECAITAAKFAAAGDFMPEEFDPLKAIRDLFHIKSEPKAPVIPATVKLLDWLETLDHNQRCQRMVEIGRESKSADLAVAAHSNRILNELAGGHFYERMLVLMSCQGSGDQKRILEFTRDQSRYLRTLASNIAVCHCDDETMLEILHSSRTDECKSLLKRLNRFKRHSIVEKFLEDISQKREQDFRSLCYFGSKSLVEKSLPELSDTMSPDDAARFSYQHPELCASFLADYAAKCKRGDLRLLYLFQRASKWLSLLKPDNSLALMEKLLPLFPASKLVCEVVNTRPVETTRLFARQLNYGGADLSRILKKLPEETLMQALDYKPFASAMANSMEHLAPALRVKVFDKCKENWRTGDSLIPSRIIELLPHESRIIEAEKQLQVPILASRLAQRLDYVRLLEWAKVKQETAESINSPDPAERALGLFTLCYAVKFNRDKVSEILEFLHNRKNEADPVRVQFLSALALLPQCIFKEEHLPALGLVIDDALSAQDLSYTSLQYIGRLYLRLFNSHTEWAGKRISVILADRGAHVLASNPFYLNEQQTNTLSAYLIEAHESWIKNEREAYLQTFSSWLSKRLKFCEPANEGLQHLCRQTKNQNASEFAARLLHDWNRPLFAKLLPELLKQDESWGCKPIVYGYLSKKRQSLLTPFLGQAALKGRFATGKIKLVPDFTSGFQRWTSKQQTIYTLALARLIQNSSSEYGDKVYGIYRLCLMPQPDASVLSKVAAQDNKELAVRDFAIRQLGTTNDGSGVPIILSCLNDERARQAIYAFRSVLLGMDATSAVNLLKSIPREKVTVVKEIVRLAGDTRAPEALAWLLELESTELHRDVRVALLRALWNFPEQEQTWQILQKTLKTGDRAFVDTAIRFPANSLSSKARRHLLNLYNIALSTNDSITRIKTLNQISTAPVIDSDHALVPALKACLACASQDEYLSASNTIIALYAGREPALLAECTKSILDRARNLRTFIQQIQTSLSRQQEVYAADARVVCMALKEDPQTIEKQIALTAAVLPWEELGDFLVKLDESGQLHFGAMQSACQSLSQPAKISELEKLESLETRLTSSKSDNLRRLALSALIGSSNVAGWTPERLARLNKFRKDQAAVVSSAARFTLPAAELANT